MRELGVPEWYIESCRKIGYLFPKAHAAAYVMMAFRIAWFKVHCPQAFYAAYFYRRSQKDSFDADCMIRGIDVVRDRITEIQSNPDHSAREDDLLTTLCSVYEFYLRGFSFTPISYEESDALKFMPVGDKQLRPPFTSVNGLNESAANELVESRARGYSIADLKDVGCLFPNINQTHIDTLRALDDLNGQLEASR